MAIPANAVYWNAYTISGFGGPGVVQSGTWTIDYELKFYCTGASPSTPAAPCCPPDPILLAKLTQIANQLDLIYSGLSSSPNSYAESTVHAGLSGNGRVTLSQSCLAVKVAITTDIASGGVDIGDPNYLFDRGYIVPITAEAPIAGDSRLVYNPQLTPLPILTEQIGYSLHPGVVISITEIIRGP
jgi:hypothetical protein